MSLTPTERERQQAATIAKVLEIVADEINLLLCEFNGFDAQSERIKEVANAFFDNLTLRAQDYTEQSEAVEEKPGSVKVIKREKVNE